MFFPQFNEDWQSKMELHTSVDLWRKKDVLYCSCTKGREVMKQVLIQRQESINDEGGHDGARQKRVFPLEVAQ